MSEEFKIDIDWEFAAPHWFDFNREDDENVDTWFESKDSENSDRITERRKRRTIQPRTPKPMKVCRMMRDENQNGNRNLGEESKSETKFDTKSSHHSSHSKIRNKSIGTNGKEYSSNFQELMKFRHVYPW